MSTPPPHPNRGLGFPRRRAAEQRALRVFLSYRRDDTGGHAGRLYDVLTARYGAGRVFMDVDAIPLGSDFGEAITRAVASCDVLIALIGRAWLTATGEDGRRRLDDPADFVRREIEVALERGVVVVPAVVQGANIPSEADLPPSLALLARRQGIELGDTSWQDDVGRLVRRLEAVVAQQQAQAPPNASVLGVPPRRRRTGLILGFGALGTLVVVGVVLAVLFARDGGRAGDGSGSETPPGEQPAGVSAAKGTVTLGSNLRTPPSGERWYCTGSGEAAPPCAFVLSRLPEADRPVVAPFDGVVTRWAVVAAGGPMRLVVLRGEVRPGGRSTLARTYGSAEQDLNGDKRASFRTRLPIRKGDTVGLQLSNGAWANAPYSQGTWLEEWIPPPGPTPTRALDISTHDYELLFNADVERDRDRDRYGDATQDACPDDAERHSAC